MEPIILRRTKEMRDVHGELIVKLPSKNVEIVYLEFSQEERDIYRALNSVGYYTQVKLIFSIRAGRYTI